MRVLAVLGVVLGASCSYSVPFRDCEVACTTACPDGFTCGAEALCRAAGANGTCAAVLDAAALDATDSSGSARDAAGDAGGGRVSGIYLASFNTNAVLVYALNATGSAAPLRTISGSDTQLATPIGIAIDHAGNIYVANLGGEVTVYAADADGDAAPSRVIDVSNPEAVAIGSGDDVFVATQKEVVFHVPPGATASDRSFQAVARSGDPYIALDEAGDVVLAIDLSVATYAATATGSPTPIRSFMLPVTQDFAPALVVVGGAIAVTEETGQILVFDEQATGPDPTDSTLAPPEIVHGDAQMALAVDASRGSPVFYVGASSSPTLATVPTSGSGADLTAGTVRSVSVPAGTQVVGIAVVP